MKLLLTSVFRPFGVDDKYGRKENKCELFHNQVTREQGVYSIRYNHRSFGLYLIAENLEMPTVVLDFPTLKQFRKELKKNYDYVGISFITSNFSKAKKMAEVVREVSPSTKIILGGHGTRIPDIEKLIECDYVIKGEGLYQLKKLFGEDINVPFKHPVVVSAHNKRVFGLPVPHRSAVLIPGVGCPNACRFCATSHFFDKTYFPFLKTGKEIFDTLVYLSKSLKTNDFFVMDENFLKHKERAMELLELLEKEKRTFNFSIFSSAEAIVSFGIENMIKLGIAYVWLGVESKKSLFEKTKGIDIKKLVSDLRKNGIIVLASSILFLEHHDKESIWEDINFTINLKPDFTQFMQLGPMPQTQLYLDYKKENKILEDVPYEEWHGQNHLWFKHPNFTIEESKKFLREAFQREFKALGPSILRIAETMINGLKSPIYQTTNPLLLQRYEALKKKCKTYYLTLTAMKLHLPSKSMKEQANHIIELYREHFGRRNILNWFATSFLYVCIFISKLKIKFGSNVHQPGLIRTMFRLTSKNYSINK